MLLTLLLGTFMMYLGAYRREILQNSRYLLFVLLWLLVFSYLSVLLRQEVGLSGYLIPYCIAPIVIRHFFTYRLAFFTHVVVILIVSMINTEGFPFLFTQLVAGVVAVLTIADARDWSVFFRSMLYIFLAYAVSLFGLSLAEGNDLSDMDWRVMGWLVGNGLLTLMAFPLIPLMERVFGFTSAISLVELADMNRPLLRELAMKAPGTFQHSLQVGNLAEAAAIEIGANPLLVRTGALYHDIGKLSHPEYFMENQPFRSPHEDLTPTESAAVIMSHVAEGLQLGRKHSLPKVITRFIATHHGTGQVSYFYRHWLREHPDETEIPAEFSYPGPLPQTKCETLVMLADTLEATARSLKDPSGQVVDELVDKVIREKLEGGQLAESRITVEDLEKCRRVFRQMLRSIHHVRAEYPET
jgi:putative nucleotidyltransferase with HDIG domain